MHRSGSRETSWSRWAGGGSGRRRHRRVPAVAQGRRGGQAILPAAATVSWHEPPKDRDRQAGQPWCRPPGTDAGDDPPQRSPCGQSGGTIPAADPGHGAWHAPLQLAQAGAAFLERPRCRLQPLQPATPSGVGGVPSASPGARLQTLERSRRGVSLREQASPRLMPPTCQCRQASIASAAASLRSDPRLLPTAVWR